MAKGKDTSATKALDFESHIELKQIAPDVFTNVHQPWLFHITYTVPGPLMMAEAAAAAYKTVPEGFRLHSLQTHFMLPPNGSKPLVYKVQRPSQGRRFAVRIVTIEQDDKPFVTITTSFVSGAHWTGRAMTHAVRMKIERRVREITLDDFEAARGPLGPFMKFERLPLVHEDPQDPSTTVAPVVAKIDPAIKSPAGTAAHILAIIYLSDYHVMDCPLSIHGVNIGMFPIGDHSKTLTPVGMKIMTSLNHTVSFHTHEGFRADELMYIEVTSPWAKDGRAMIHSRIFSNQGLLVATCTQEV
ncbi:acyl-CoA thioesterase II [Rhinocladiella mackenziei CBS 650.93]|uniref:Acyl-CoA thioesterase II n=1 Tax=Rhinocladiella mackenziei CBS 650.93 TaxID=1442369 RepID=A0A0D2H8Z1_9EURO|nr:acyl-CoA thioesterase II [Rhinocladiella mackenziei CBS 650.93]KIX06943.1 acyl-CoA thioesterase II [Rhinocladiella mackenziei CBS 650.93]